MNTFSDWRRQSAFQVGAVGTSKQQEDLESELDALVSSLYGLSRNQIAHMFATFHRGWDFQPRLTKVLEYFDQIGAKA